MLASTPHGQTISAIATVILAAGKGTRMKSDVHKVLHPVGGRPMLEHLFQIRLAPFTAGTGDRRRARTRDSLRQPWASERQLPYKTRSSAPVTRCSRREKRSRASPVQVLILYGDVPFVRTETMQAMLARLGEADKPAVVVLGFEPDDPLQYGRVIAHDGAIQKMVEHKDANDAEKACRLCNSGLMAVQAEDLFALLDRVGNDNAQGEYYLTDIVNIANTDGRTCAVVVTDDPGEVAGINSRAELAAAEALWQKPGAKRRWPTASACAIPARSGSRGIRNSGVMSRSNACRLRPRRRDCRRRNDPRVQPSGRRESRPELRSRPTRACAPAR
ncbi:MAG: NTP transferase domain-containing protein [Sphingomonadaceae bacterium]